MNIGFVNPWMLWGLLAAALPVIIHLINRRRARIIRFSATYFVQLSNRRLARSLKLKQLLLLLLRTLLLAFLALALARPYTLPQQQHIAAESDLTPTSRILIVDRSLSMQAQTQGKPLFELAREQVKQLIQGFRDSDNFALLPSPPMDEDSLVELTFDRGRLLRELDELQPSYRKTDFSRSLDQARLLAQGSALAKSAVYLIGDVTRVGYETDFTISGKQESLPILLDVRQATSIANVAITDLQSERSFFTGLRDWKISVTVANYGEQPVSGLGLSLLANEQGRADGFVDIAPFQSVTKEFIQRFEQSGTVRLEASLADDLLLADNRRFGLVNVSRDLTVLLVNGRPSTTRHLDEVFYLKEALNPGGLNRSQITPEVVSPSALASNDLSRYDIIFLCNVARFTDTQAEKLLAYVRSGKVAVLTFGPEVDVDNYNQRLASLLPGNLRGSKVASESTSGRSDAVYLSRFDYRQPVFRIFDDDTAKSLYEAKVSEYMTFDPDATRDKRILLRYTDHSPALVEITVDQGRSLVFTSSISRSWNDIPIQPGFLPLMQELSHHIADSRQQDEELRVLVTGDRYRPKGDNGKLTIKTPQGKKLSLDSASDSKLSGSPPLEQPGFYTVSNRKNNWTVAVNVDPAESDLRVLPKAERPAIFGERALLANAGGGLPEQRIEQAGLLMWLLLLLLVGEVLVLRWMR